MPELGTLWWRIGIKDFTDADIKKINDKLKNLGSDLLINPKLAKSVTEILPKGIKLELEPQLKAVSNEALAKAVKGKAQGKVMKVEIAPLLTNLRKALKDATKYITLEVCEYRNHIAKFTVLDGAKKGEDPLGISSLIILPLILLSKGKVVAGISRQVGCSGCRRERSSSGEILGSSRGNPLRLSGRLYLPSAY